MAFATHAVFELPSNAAIGPSRGTLMSGEEPNELAETVAAPTGADTV